MPANPRNPRIKREIFSHAYTPVCPVHLVGMVSYKTGRKATYFRCIHYGEGCPYRDKAPRVKFVPYTERGN